MIQGLGWWGGNGVQAGAGPICVGIKTKMMVLANVCVEHMDSKDGW